MVGNPQRGNITWYVNGVKTPGVDDKFALLDKGRILNIGDITAATEGEFKCFLDNGVPGSVCKQAYFISEWHYIYL